MTVETLTPAGPLEAWRPAVAALNDLVGATGLTVELMRDRPALDLRLVATGPALCDVAEALGGPLPIAPGEWSPVGDGRVHRLGPDQWLVTGSAAREDVVRPVARAHGGAAVDVSDQRVALRLSGPGARAVLAFGCALDLRPRVRHVGASAQTVIWQSPCLLVVDAAPDGSDVVDLLVRTSFAGHLLARLLDAAPELRPLP